MFGAHEVPVSGANLRQKWYVNPYRFGAEKIKHGGKLKGRLFSWLTAKALGSAIHIATVVRHNTIRDYEPRIRCMRIYQFDDEYEQFWQKIRNDFDITFERNKECMNWRCVQAPQLKGAYFIFKATDDAGLVRGYAVLRELYHKEYIPGYYELVDLICARDDEPAMKSLISHVYSFVRARDGCVLLVWGFPPVVQHLLKVYHPFESFDAIPRYWVRDPQQGFSNGDWWITGIDGDKNL
jgi:hypothetical protein